MSDSISDCFIERKTNIELFAQAKFQKLKKAHCKTVRAIFLSDLKSLWTSLASSRHSAPSICGESRNFCWIENDRFSKISGKGKNLKLDTNFQKHIPENFSSIQLCESWNFREIFFSLHACTGKSLCCRVVYKEPIAADDIGDQLSKYDSDSLRYENLLFCKSLTTRVNSK